MPKLDESNRRAVLNTLAGPFVYLFGGQPQILARRAGPVIDLTNQTRKRGNPLNHHYLTSIYSIDIMPTLHTLG